MARPEAQTNGLDQAPKPDQIITTFSQFQAAVNEIWRDCPDNRCGAIRCCCPGEPPHTQAVIEVELTHASKLISSPAFALPQNIESLRVGVENFLAEGFKKFNAQMEAVPHTRDLAAQQGRQSFY